jgi:hypothetical protein
MSLAPLRVSSAPVNSMATKIFTTRRSFSIFLRRRPCQSALAASSFSIYMQFLRADDQDVSSVDSQSRSCDIDVVGRAAQALIGSGARGLIYSRGIRVPRTGML